MARAAFLLLAVCATIAPTFAQPATGTATSPTPPLRWVQHATLPAKFPQAGDLCSVGDDLYVAAATDALAKNGQALFKLTPDDTLSPVLVRSGQGFLRIHPHGDRLFVPDADAPLTASIVFRLNTDGFVYSFAPSEPAAAKREVIPHVYHVFDTAELDSRIYASAGAYADSEVPYRAKRNPAALYLREAAEKPWRRLVECPLVPKGTETGVVRFTYLLPLENGRLLAGLTDWSGSLGGDGAVLIEGLPDHPKVRRLVGLSGNTLRWFRWRSLIFQIGESAGTTHLSVSADGGHSFALVAGAPALPQSLARIDGALALLADGVLHRSDDGATFTALTAQNPALRHHAHPLLTAPLILHRGKLWAADPQHGSIWATEPVAPPPAN